MPEDLKTNNFNKVHVFQNKNSKLKTYHCVNKIKVSHTKTQT